MARPSTFILASASPRRLQLLKQIGLAPDQVIPADIDETPRKGELPDDYAMRMAEDKLAIVAAQYHDAVVLAADTVVACGRRILPKAENEKTARKCLELLSGRRHRVYTALCISAPSPACRPGTYTGGTDETTMHDLVNEVFDNAMAEVLAGFADTIELEMRPNNMIIVRDNGRGIPIDRHAKFPKKSALEVVMTMSHSGGKSSAKVYDIAGGLHDCGLSVVNAVSDYIEVEVVRHRTIYRQTYSRGEPTSKLQEMGEALKKRGTTVTFHPAADIFGKARFKPEKLYKLARSKAYHRGVEIRWKCDPSLLPEGSVVPAEEVLHFSGDLTDSLKQQRSKLVMTQVRFNRLSEKDIAHYIASNEWNGKAGGYAIQGLAESFIPWISGSYSNVVGLPLAETCKMLAAVGVKSW